MRTRRLSKKTPKFIQILSSQWEGDTGLQSSIYALSDDGKVYRWLAGKKQWQLLEDE